MTSFAVVSTYFRRILLTLVATTMLAPVALAQSPTIPDPIEGVGRWLAVSPDSKWLAYMEKAGPIVVLDLETNEVRSRIVPDREFVVGLAFSLDGTRLVGVFVDGEVRVWDWVRNKTIIAFEAAAPKPKEKDVVSLHPALSPDARYVAFAVSTSPRKRRETRVIIQDTSTGKKLKDFKVDSGTLTAFTFGNDGELILASFEGVVSKMSVEHAPRTTATHTTREAPMTIAGSTDGRMIAEGLGETLSLVDVATGEVLWQVPGSSRIGSALRFDDSNRLLAITGNGKIEVYDTASGRLLITLEGHQPQRMIPSFAFDRRRSWLISVSDDETLRFWSLAGLPK